MDEHIDRTMLDNFANNCENMEIRKTSHAQGVLRGAENGSLQFMSIQSREQEYIDHTLLGPEYITNTISNSFIIDLMEQDSPGQNVNDCTIASLGANEAFPSEAQLHTILQFVNRQGQIRTQTNITAESSSDHLIHHTDKEIIDSDFMAMHGNLLNEQNFKIFCNQQSIPTQEALSQNLNVNVSPLRSLPAATSPLTPMRWLKKERYEEALEEVSELVGPLGGTARKILPHKKRISKKLKIMDKLENLYPINEEIPLRNDRLVISNGAQFECELCGSISESQVQFFSHLKEHYEPTTLREIKCESQNMRPSSIVIAESDISVIEKTQTPQSTVVGDQMFNEVELNFDSFSEVVGLSTQQQHVSHNAADQPELKILSSNVIAKCMEYVVQTQDTTQAVDTSHEVEFSDTEDMLEGIRGVVDKVSVDDTSDDLDMPPTSVSKEPWFTNSAFNALAFKDDAINNESFQRVSDLIPMHPVQKNASDRTEKPITSMQTNQGDNEYHDDDDGDNDGGDHHDGFSSDDLNDSPIEFLKRKRGRPKGSKKKKPSTEIKFEDESSNDMDDNYKRRYICSKCNREFNSCNALKYHDLSHTGERPHQCDVCGKSFFSQSALKSHLRVHTGDKPYECDQCHRKFRQWSDLKYHIVSIHSNEKNYQCEFCGKSFSRKYSLVIHRRIHTSERNYKCEFCPKTFRASSYLQNHRKIHTGEKPYECKTCGKKFRVSGDLRRHGRTHDRSFKTPVESKNPSRSIVNTSKSQVDVLEDIKPDELLKVDYQKTSKDDLLFLDKMSTKIDHLFKTEDAFVNASIGNSELSFVT